MHANNPINPNEQTTNALMRYANEVIYMYFSRAHANEVPPPALPPDPVQWLGDHFQGMEPVTMVSVITGLVLRGATPRTCARYVLSGDVELPFQGCEQAMFNTLIAELSRRGHNLPRIMHVIELIALIVTNVTRLTGVHPESALNRVDAGETDA